MHRRVRLAENCRACRFPQYPLIYETCQRNAIVFLARKFRRRLGLRAFILSRRAASNEENIGDNEYTEAWERWTNGNHYIDEQMYVHAWEYSTAAEKKKIFNRLQLSISQFGN